MLGHFGQQSHHPAWVFCGVWTYILPMQGESVKQGQPSRFLF
uniref:Uncharacterized protein n=1 Tax=Rhizophora mucronata TaxID=61149 RepID=A0A2P2Q7Q3_RHIMU